MGFIRGLSVYAVVGFLCGPPKVLVSLSGFRIQDFGLAGVHIEDRGFKPLSLSRLFGLKA